MASVVSCDTIGKDLVNWLTGKSKVETDKLINAIFGNIQNCSSKALSVDDTLATCANLKDAIAAALDALKNNYNDGTNLPSDAEDCDRAVTICGVIRMLGYAAGDNDLQKAILDFLGKAIKNNPTFKQTITNALISTDEGNLIKRGSDNGLYYGITAPADIANQYVSTSLGNDSNTGTKDSPLRTVEEAVNRIGTRGASGDFYIKLRAGETFATTKSSSVGAGAVSLHFAYYDDATFGEQTVYNSWIPEASTALNRPTLVLNTYADSTGTIQGSGISGTNPSRLYFAGVNLTLKTDKGITTGGGWFLYWNIMDFLGSTIDMSSSVLGVGSAGSIILRAVNLNIGTKTKAFISDNNPAIQALPPATAGDVQKSTVSGYPDVTVWGFNDSKVLTVENAMAYATYDKTTKTLFGYNCNFDIFANG